MFIGVTTYKEGSRIEKLEIKHPIVFKLLELISKFDDLDIIEIHIIKEEVI